MKQLPILLLFTCSLSYAQPNTEIYLFDLSEKGISNPVNISNNDGYDNQPSFWPDNQSVLYARTVNGQTEIARYFIGSKRTEVISKTPQGGEYSPLKIPNQEAISAIRLDTSGLQLLYRYALDGNWTVAVPDLKIGYHTWISPDEIVCFVLGEPATLQWVNTTTGEAKILKENIGRSIHVIPSADELSYLDKSASPWTLLRLNPKTGNATEIIKITSENEDYCWSPAGNIFTGQDNKLMKFTAKNGWQQVADLTEFGMTGAISRLAISPDGKQLAVVVAQ